MPIQIQAQDRPPYLSFKIESVEDRAASIAAGHYMAKDEIYVTVHRPGSRDTHVEIAEAWIRKQEERADAGLTPVEWAQHFRRQFEAFKNKQELPPDGSPLKHWPVLSPSQVENLLSLGFKTIEDVAGAPDSSLDKLMGGITLKQKARAWLDEAKTKGASAETIAALEVKLNDLKLLTERLLAENAELKAKSGNPLLAKKV